MREPVPFHESIHLFIGGLADEGEEDETAYAALNMACTMLEITEIPPEHIGAIITRLERAKQWASESGRNYVNIPPLVQSTIENLQARRT